MRGGSNGTLWIVARWYGISLGGARDSCVPSAQVDNSSMVNQRKKVSLRDTMNRQLTALAILHLAMLGPLHGQHATFVGTVTDAFTGLPLPGAHVNLRDKRTAVSSDADGEFRLNGVVSGEVTIDVRMSGYQPGSAQVDIELFGAVTVDVGIIALSRMGVEMEPLVVEEMAVNQKLARVGFYRRRNSEHGTFITRAEIASRQPRNTSELLRQIPAFRTTVEGVGGFAYGGRSVRRLSRRPAISEFCGVTYYIDGVRAEGAFIDNILPNSIAAMELYAGPATIPPQFRVFSGNPMCGVIVFWTRTGASRTDG